MSRPPPASIVPVETIHASCVAIAGRALLLLGPSGAGKSDLALRLIDRGAQLVSDDQTTLARDGSQLIASPPPTIAGQIEARGIGILSLPFVTDVPVALAIELSGSVERYPMTALTLALGGVDLPLMRLSPFEASAPIKAEMMLRAGEETCG
ncbi:HPr kinase/phosphorylase [Sphingobium subterraneum]|uniref:Serine kinase of HPr protein (Carbohydrate metabolism regulator) n=1 Tax=Sphingobium subterraneum TaxID=627688 RepID=A0A841J1U1_9SPHN|nr:HPr kinase/phosphatase C-terminal domain-containing protein [Sphingobium subterraneum]MBB6122615.1 serine kinase of HPr protein (carbohydrate metabolism regulator) [Sphingobium subterraneum]